MISNQCFDTGEKKNREINVMEEISKATKYPKLCTLALYGLVKNLLQSNGHEMKYNNIISVRFGLLYENHKWNRSVFF